MSAAPLTLDPAPPRIPSTAPVRMIAIDLDGTLIGGEGAVTEASRAALHAAMAAGIEIVIATGRRHSYAYKVIENLGLPSTLTLISSNGAVVRTLASDLIETTLMDPAAAAWLCQHLGDYRNALVITFDHVGPGGEDTCGALVVEELANLNTSIARWIEANKASIEIVSPIERSLDHEAPLQMMLCGTCERMRRAELLMLADPRVAAVGERHAETRISLNRTEYPDRDLSIVDILPAGCSKGAALLRLAATRGFAAAELMAVGDNWNDVSMLEVVGHPILMANAPEDLLETVAARGWRMTLSNEQEGVAAAIHAMLAERSS